jgi:3-hydroxyisobutyrate dehydrogenase-like beta-hydroxyacid dehydrogenase
VARELGVPVPSAHAADEVLTEAAQLGYEHRDIAGLFQVLGTLQSSMPPVTNASSAQG